MQRGIIVGQDAKLGTSHVNSVRPSTEAPSEEQTNEQATENSGQSKTNDSGTGKHLYLF